MLWPSIISFRANCKESSVYCLYRLTGVEDRKCWEISFEMFVDVEVEVGETVLGGGCSEIVEIFVVVSEEDGVKEVM